jgi:hypothetical protein
MTDSPERPDVLPSLAIAYHERGYEAGYSRGVNNTLAAVLEATEEFARLRPESAAETRRLLYAFSEFLEKQIGPTPVDFGHDFVDGLGI